MYIKEIFVGFIGGDETLTIKRDDLKIMLLGEGVRGHNKSF